MRGVLERQIFLRDVAQKRLGNDPTSRVPGNGDGPVGTLTVHDDNFIRKRHRGQAPGQILFLVIGDDTDAQGRGMHWVPFARVVPPVKRMLYSERGGGLSAAATGPFPPAPTPGRVYQGAAARYSRKHASLLGPPVARASS